MFIKRMSRKPLLPLLLLTVILVGMIFPAAMSQVIDKSYTELEELYESMTIQCQLLPQTHIGADFSLEPSLGNQIVQVDEVSAYYCELSCPYYFRDPGPSSGNSIAYGTNDIYRFASAHGLEIKLSEEHETVDFSNGENICIVSRDLLDASSRNIGDRVTVAGSESFAKKDENAPDLVLTVVGVFKSDDTDIPWNTIIVPASSFFETGELVSTPEGIRNWRSYTAFDFTIDPTYNRTFDSVKESLQSIIGEEWLLYSTSRELYNAVQPLEKKLNVQQLIFNVMTVLFLCLPALITFMICIKDKSEVLIRIMHGENAVKVFFTSWMSYGGMILSFGALSLSIANAIGTFSLWYAVGIITISIFAAGVTIGVICKTKLVTLYQSREG